MPVCMNTPCVVLTTAAGSTVTWQVYSKVAVSGGAPSSRKMVTLTLVQAGFVQPIPGVDRLDSAGLGAQSGSPFGSTTGCSRASKLRMFWKPMTL